MSLNLPPDPNTQNETQRMLVALVLITFILIGWNMFYKPQPVTPPPAPLAAGAAAEPAKIATREEVLQAGARLPIRSLKLHGSIALTGGRFDDVTLARYRETVDPNSPEIALLAPAGTKDAYFAEFGWLGEGVAVPDNRTVWKTDAKEITPNQRVTLWWDNGQGLRFERRITLDDNYMFTLEDVVINQSGNAVNLTPFGRIQRRTVDTGQHYAISHEGGVGVLGGELHEVTYKNLQKEGAQRINSRGGWIGFGDKYWLSAAVLDGQQDVQTQFSLLDKVDPNAKEPQALRYQADFSGQPRALEAGQSLTNTTRFFAGAKELNVLDAYTKAGIPLFDRAVDFGMLYFLTKPIFHLLNYFYHLLGNFGLAILLLTVVIKAAMFPLANKSYRAMNKMKALQPQMQELKDKHGEDKLRLQQEMMALYKREQVNPAGGCLPMLVQIPVFFALYKVLFVTIEMRHAPFYGWIRDLSAPDPSNIFTLFGLIDWHPPTLLHLGVLPILMCITMILQQKLNPKPADKTQAMVMNVMPYFFLYLLSGFPVGLVIYWSWSNILTILQQLFISHSAKQEELRAPVASKKKAKPQVTILPPAKPTGPASGKGKKR